LKTSICLQLPDYTDDFQTIVSFLPLLNTFLTFFERKRNFLARYLVILVYSSLTIKRQDMKVKNLLLIIATIGLALIPFIKNGFSKHDEFDATQDLFI
jgi:hypothetical protein